MASNARRKSMLEKTPTTKVQTFLDRFGKALEQGHIGDVVNMFQADCYWRDLVTFTWNLKTMEGKDQIREMLESTLAKTKPSGWKVAEGEEATEDGGVTTAWIEFETEAARGFGLIRLKDGLIWTLLTTMAELKGHEEKSGFTRPLGAKHGHGKDRKSWREERDDDFELGFEATLCRDHRRRPGRHRARRAAAAARRVGHHHRKNGRAGDSWRKRYKSLCLHDPVWYDHLPYIDFPKNWPIFAPKDKIGDWLEMYTKVMELNYWSSTTAKSASYDDKTKEWTIVVERDGKEITLKPKQLVLATGMSGKANWPKYKGQDIFKGEQQHSSTHPGPEKYRGKKVVVIGSNNSAHDICAALWEGGADVTMVQRSSTHIVRSDTLMDIGLGALYSEQAVANGMTTRKADLIFASLPTRSCMSSRSRSTTRCASGTRISTTRWKEPASCSTGATTIPACS
jgi:putative flavoprotein involved in K+ transport